MDGLIFGIFAVFKLCNTTWCIYRCIIGRQECTLSINLQCQVCVCVFAAHSFVVFCLEH